MKPALQGSAASGAPSVRPHVAIACGGTGGHLFPGLAVAGEFLRRGCEVTLLISPREIDQDAVRAARGMRIEILPAVGLTRGGAIPFWRGFFKSYAAARRLFRAHRPQAVLAMGGFTSAPPVLAGKFAGAKSYLHESNTLPGRANRFLAHWVDEAFVYFPEAAGGLNLQKVHVSGMPLREGFQSPMEKPAARLSLGLAPDRPVLLAMGGSQGASRINELVREALPLLAKEIPDLQFIHLTGTRDAGETQAAYRALNLRAIVRPFLTEMELALGAATVAVSRAGASSIAEFAAMRLPSLLIPYPSAADNHQFYNAAALADTGAAIMAGQSSLTPKLLAGLVAGLLNDGPRLERIQRALAQWHQEDAAERIVRHILASIAAAGFPVAASGGPSEGSMLSDRFYLATPRPR